MAIEFLSKRSILYQWEWCESWEDAVSEVGRRVSWVAPASTSNLTGYPGDLKFPGRCDRFETNFSSNWRPRFATYGLSIGWHLCLWPGWRYPARQWPGPGSWRGGEQPGRWSPGGWRSCGGRSFNFYKKVWRRQQEPVLGGFFCPVWRHPPDNGRWQNSIKKVKVENAPNKLCPVLSLSLFRPCSFCFVIFSSVLDKESNDLKVLAFV